MWFKKTSLNKPIYSQKIVTTVLTIVALFVVWMMGIVAYWYVEDLNFNLPKVLSFWLVGWTTSKEKTNILIIGRWWGNHDGADLTDSIILMSVAGDSNVITMLSIPRDMYVDYPNWGKGKINDVYRRGLENWKASDKEAISKLEEKIQEMTGENINYYVNIDFEGFKKIIDLVWWVQVTLAENLVDTEYPNQNENWYTTFMLKKWTWTIDGETALKYARSRHSTSDFDRSLRQQQIISSLKEKINSQWYLSNPSKLQELYSIVSQYIKTDLDISTLVKLAIQSREENKIISLNLNNSCYFWSPVCQRGWFLYTPDRNLFWWASTVIPNNATYRDLWKYAEINKFANIIFDHRQIFAEDMKINIFNATKKGNIAKTLADDLIRYGFNVPAKWSIGNTSWKAYNQTTIYYSNSWSQIPETIKALQLFFNAQLQKTQSPIYSKEPDTAIEIVLWDDYKEITPEEDLTWAKK